MQNGGASLEAERFEPLTGLPPWLRALRPLQWTKNLLVFAALLFARDTFHVEPLVQSILAFVAFCAVSSSVYLINDVRDRQQDQLHPIKRLRPVATGELSQRAALQLSAVLALGGLLTGLLVRPELLLVLAVYLAVMAGYNLGLKQVVVLDVMLIALGFVLRAAGGAVAIDVPISPWLYICTLVVSLLIGFGKRRHELLALEGGAAHHRQSLDAYSVTLLDQCIAVSAAATVLAYSVYTFQSASLPDNHAMMLTIPIVVYAVFRYLYLLYVRRSGGSPEVLLVTDRPLQLSVIAWVLSSAAILYWA
jgi:4-hydroxybenzoate polyprenyltransferase